MNITNADARKIITGNLFQINDEIEPIYLELAEIVLSTFYKAFPFHTLFEGFRWENKANESFISAVKVWADCFMSWEINDIEKVKITIFKLIELQDLPSTGIFKFYYDKAKIEPNTKKINKLSTVKHQ